MNQINPIIATTLLRPLRAWCSGTFPETHRQLLRVVHLCSRASRHVRNTLPSRWGGRARRDPASHGDTHTQSRQELTGLRGRSLCSILERDTALLPLATSEAHWCVCLVSCLGDLGHLGLPRSARHGGEPEATCRVLTWPDVLGTAAFILGLGEKGGRLMYESDLHLGENRPYGNFLCLDAICRASRICTWGGEICNAIN